jgi:hypothetical protein
MASCGPVQVNCLDKWQRLRAWLGAPLRLAGRPASFIGTIQCVPSFGIAALLLATPAYATASLSCSANDKSLRFSAEGIVSHGVGETVAQFAGELEVRLKDAPPGLRKLPLALEHLTQRWLHGREVKLRLYREREREREGDGQGSVELVVATRRAGKDETEFSGSYVLTVSGEDAAPGAPARTLKARGRASCSLG